MVGIAQVIKIPREEVTAPRLPEFKKHLDNAPSNLLWFLEWSCAEPGVQFLVDPFQLRILCDAIWVSQISHWVWPSTTWEQYFVLFLSICAWKFFNLQKLVYSTALSFTQKVSEQEKFLLQKPQKRSWSLSSKIWKILMECLVGVFQLPYEKNSRSEKLSFLKI